jgi:hypothetical protein
VAAGRLVLSVGGIACHLDHSPITRRVCSIRASAMLVRDSRTKAKGAFGRHERHESAGMRLVTAASR